MDAVIPFPLSFDWKDDMTINDTNVGWSGSSSIN